MIEIVSATRLSREEFWKKSALGISLRRLKNTNKLTPRIAFENKKGMPEIYNKRISSAENHQILVFIHDDVWIDDCFFGERIHEGLEVFDVIGVAGNRRRVPDQPSWAFLDDKFTWDDKSNLSGKVAHGSGPFSRITTYGHVPAKCKLLDDIFLATKKASLVDNHILFDQRFKFHFVDMDFCRTAISKGLQLGTWPICLTHQSRGAYSSSEWRTNYRIYQEKWGN